MTEPQQVEPEPTEDPTPCRICFAFQAWALGLATAALVTLPVSEAIQSAQRGAAWSVALARILPDLEGSVRALAMTFTFGALISFPLFFIGAVVAVACHAAILRAPAAFALAAPLVAMTLFSTVAAMRAPSFWPKFGDAFGAIENHLMFAAPVFVGAAYYCYRVARWERRQTPRKTALA